MWLLVQFSNHRPKNRNESGLVCIFTAGQVSSVWGNSSSLVSLNPPHCRLHGWLVFPTSDCMVHQPDWEMKAEWYWQPNSNSENAHSVAANREGIISLIALSRFPLHSIILLTLTMQRDCNTYVSKWLCLQLSFPSVPKDIAIHILVFGAVNNKFCSWSLARGGQFKIMLCNEYLQSDAGYIRIVLNIKPCPSSTSGWRKKSGFVAH